MPPPSDPSPARTSSVARSLAQAAAALRDQEWRGANVTDARAYSGHRRSDVAMAYTEQERYDREAFYEELRARHRDLTQRQRLARELYGQPPQQQWVPQPRRSTTYREDAVPSAAGENDSYDRMQIKRQRLVMDGRLRRHQQEPPTANAQYRATAYPAPVQLVSSLVPRVNAAVERRLRSSMDREDDANIDFMIDNQRVVRPMQMQPRAVTPGSVMRASSGPMQRPTAVAPVQVPDTRVVTPQTSKSPSSDGTPRAERTETEESVATAPSVVEDNDNEPDSEAAVVEDDMQVEKKQKKRVRYLRDTDRRNIIKRIEKGEKQASLAREFGVTRAAICHIKKNRFEILSRYNMLVKSAQEMDLAENFVGPPGVDMMVHEVRANSVLLLMTTLRDNRSSGATFRRVAGRLIMILLEEALAILGTESVEVVTGTGHLYRGLERRHQFCGVAIGAEGFPFLVLFHQMEPEAPQGSIHVEMATDRRGERAWRLDHMDLPANIAQYKVLLFSATCGTGEAECKAIEALCSVGCDESSISLVVVLASSDGITYVSNSFPQVKIVTGGIDGKVDPQTNNIIPGIGDFVSRYNS